MNAQKIEEINKLLQDIMYIDNSINEIDRIGLVIASGNSIQVLKLIVSGGVEEPSEIPNRSSIQDVMEAMRTGFMFGMPQPRMRTNSLDYDITDVTALKILALLLESQHKHRKELISKLNKLGVKF